MPQKESKPENTISDRDLYSTGRFLKDAFIRKKSEKLRGKKYKPQARHNDQVIWDRAAAICIELSADPEDFVAAAFEYTSHFPGGALPTHLSGPKMKDMYTRYCVYHGRDISEELRDAASLTYDPFLTGMKNAKGEAEAAVAQVVNYIHNSTGQKTKEDLKMDRAALAVLADEHTPAEAWVRVILGFRDDEIMYKYYGTAAKQFRSRPLLKEAAMLLELPVDKAVAYGEKLRELGLLRQSEHGGETLNQLKTFCHGK